MMKFVYVDSKPDGTPFYVGKAGKYRLTKLERNHWHSAICERYPDWKRTVVFSGDEQACLNEEMRLIKLYGRRQIGLGPLVNFTDGGEGTYGLSDESRRRIGLASKNRIRKKESYEKAAAKLRGRVLSDETRKKMSDAAKNRSTEIKQKIYLATYAAKQKPEYCYSHSDETRNKISNSIKKWHQERKAATV